MVSFRKKHVFTCLQDRKSILVCLSLVQITHDVRDVHTQVSLNELSSENRICGKLALFCVSLAIYCKHHILN